MSRLTVARNASAGQGQGKRNERSPEASPQFRFGATTGSKISASPSPARLLRPRRIDPPVPQPPNDSYGQAMHPSRDLLTLPIRETPDVREPTVPQRDTGQAAIRNLRAANTTTTSTAPASNTPRPPTPVSGVVAAPRVGIGVRVLVA